MALKMIKAAAIVLLAVIISPAIVASAKEYVVGDDSGWSTSVDYEAWAKGKTFYVGDILAFNYGEGYHTVVKVNGSGFTQCQISPNSGILTSGSDRVTLATPGNKWYICGVADHCSHYSQKLKITVLPKESHMSPTMSPMMSEMPVPMAAPAPWSALMPEISAPTEALAGSPWYK